MPDLKLSAEEAGALAIYLTDSKTEPIEPLSLPDAPTSDEIRDASGWRSVRIAAPFDAVPAEQQLAQLGRQVMHERRCTSCHELKVSGEEAVLAAPPANSDLRRSTAGAGSDPNSGMSCSHRTQKIGQEQTDPAIRYSIPQFAETLNRAAVREFLAAAGKSSGAPAPSESAQLTLARFNCQACHERDGIGGLAPEFVNLISANQSAQEAELVKPPTLSGITEKFLGKSLEAVLTGDRRSRPWMSVRMPHFGKEHVGHLSAALASLEATSVAEQAAATSARLASGGSGPPTGRR